MLEVGDELLNGLHYLGLGEVVLGEDGFEFGEEVVDFVHRPAGGLLNDSEGGESLHVDFLAWDVEFFVGFLAGGVGLEIDYGIVFGFVGHLSSKFLRFWVIIAFNLIKALCFYKVVADSGEGQHLVFSEFREEDFASIAKDTSQHTDLT